MKKLLICALILSTYPLTASVNCLDNSKHLSEDFDDKEWHSVACDCPCAQIKGNKCVKCGHLQNASTYTVVTPSKVAQETKRNYPSSDPKAIIRQLAAEFLKKVKNKRND